MRTPDIGEVERALYDERRLLRILGMRRTMFVLPAELAPAVQAACTRRIAVQQRRLTEQLLDTAGVADDSGRWLREVEEETLQALRERGEATAATLSEAVPRLRQQVWMAEGKSYGGPQNITSRVLLQLGADGRIVRGRPQGSWTSTQYRWSPVDYWLPGGMEAWSTEAAQVELARRWLAVFGPGTRTDLRWWTGWTAGEVKRALAGVGHAEVDLDGGTGLVLRDDLEPVPAPEPWAALLPALDPSVMGWLGREWFLGTEAAGRLFDRSGNAGPTVWWDGRVVGGWAQRKDGEVAFRLLEDVGSDAVRAIEAAAARLGGWLGKTRITPRFRTPLERELTSER